MKKDKKDVGFYSLICLLFHGYMSTYTALLNTLQQVLSLVKIFPAEFQETFNKEMGKALNSAIVDQNHCKLIEKLVKMQDDITPKVPRKEENNAEVS